MKLKTFLIILAVVVVSLAIGFAVGKKEPDLYQKLEQIEGKAESCAKKAYKEAKHKVKEARECDGKNKKDEIIVVESNM